MITEIEDYFSKGCGRCDRFDTSECSALLWRDGLKDLRALCRDAGLEEVVRWGHPCYRHANRNVALIGAFRGDFRLSFFEAGLMKDPEGLLEKPGPNTAHASTIRFTDCGGPKRQAAIIRAYLAEAMGYAAQGLKAPKVERAVELPETLVEALDADPELAEAFHGLTPGRQRSYVIHLSSAKSAETQRRRVAKARDKILSGKGANER